MSKGSKRRPRDDRYCSPQQFADRFDGIDWEGEGKPLKNVAIHPFGQGYSIFMSASEHPTKERLADGEIVMLWTADEEPFKAKVELHKNRKAVFYRLEPKKPPAVDAEEEAAFQRVLDRLNGIDIVPVPDCPPNTAFLLSPRKPNETDAQWAKRCCVIKNIEDAK